MARLLGMTKPVFENRLLQRTFGGWAVAMILRISLLIVLSEAVSTDASAVLFNILDAGDPYRFKVP